MLSTITGAALMTMAGGREVEVTNALGLHLRAADRFVRLARTYASTIRVFHGEKTADGKSILDLTCLAAMQGDRLRLETAGPDALEALQALIELVHNGFDDGHDGSSVGGR